MRYLSMGLYLAACLLFVTGPGRAAEFEAKIVQTEKVWEQEGRIAATDLARFKDRWFCAATQASGEPLRVLTSSMDGAWESIASLHSPKPSHGLYHPRIGVTPKGGLMITATGTISVVTSKAMFNSRQALVWSSDDGRDWKGADHLGESNYIVSGFGWHKGTAYGYGHGCICGIAQTVQIRASREGGRFSDHYEETFSGFFPGKASLVFSRDKGYCFMSRSKLGLVGVSKEPYEHWEWTDLRRRISRPNTIRMSNGRIIVSAALHDDRLRTSLCWFDPESVTLQEFLELPVPGAALDVGLAELDGHLWVSYHAPEEGKYRIHLAKIRLNAMR